MNKYVLVALSFVAGVASLYVFQMMRGATSWSGADVFGSEPDGPADPVIQASGVVTMPGFYEEI